MDRVWIVVLKDHSVWEVFQNREAACDAWTSAVYPREVGWELYLDVWSCVDDRGHLTGITVIEKEVRG